MKKMKKNELSVFFHPWKKTLKTLLAMKIIILLTSVFAFTLNASVYPQGTRMSIEVEDQTIRQVLQEIESQSEYRFFYNDQLADLDDKVDFKAEKMNEFEAIENLFEGQELTFKLMENNLILIISASLIQQNSIIGTVTDENGEPLPGVSIFIKGTTQGTITDLEGKYTILVDGPEAVLVYSYVGMLSQEVSIDNQTEINVTLQPDIVGLEEVVVIGYGTVKKSDLTGGISTVAGNVIAERKTTQVSHALQGATSGVSVTRSSGDPGTSATIRIRGITTIGNNNPLIIVDGVPVDNIDQINPNDIEDISVLKDAASASIYGSRAAAGVILVTTKRSKTGELSLNYDFNIGFETPTERPEVVDAIRYMEMNNEMSWNDNGNTGEEYPIFAKNEIDNYYELNKQDPNQYPITDWENLTMNKRAPLQRHNLNILGGSKAVKVNGSFSYETNDGLYVHRTFERINSRINTDISIKEDLLNAKMDFFFQRDIQERPVTSPSRVGYMAGPVYPATWTDGRVAGGKNGDNIYGQMEYGGTRNNSGNLVGGKLEINFLPFNGLNIKALISPSFRFDSEKSFTKKVPYYDAEDPTQFLGYLTGKNRTYLMERRHQNQNYTIQFVANYEKEFGKHSLNAMAGYEEYSSFTENMGASRDDYDFSYFPYLDLGPLDFRDNYGYAFENAYRSFFGRILYNYSNRYLFQGNVRYDGSSRFHSDYRWGLFPSLSAGWVVSHESFWKENNTFSYLKLRGSFGTLGNERIGNYPYQSTIGFQPGILYFQGSNVVSSTGAAQTNWAIEDITWEKTETINFGLDAYFFDNKLQLTGDIYSKKTSDMLLALEIPSFMGFSNPDQNAGSMETKGWDLEISWRDRIGELTYSVSANIFDAKTLMNDLSGTEFKGSQITAEGTEYQEWYGYRSDGLFQTQEEIENSAVLNAAIRPGDVKHLDISGPEGVPDGIISPDYDRVPLGGSLPRYMFGSNLSLEYKNFDFSLVIQGVGKQNLVISGEVYPLRTRGWYNAPKIYDGNYWSNYNSAEENLNAEYPRLSDIGNGNNYTMSDHWIINGAYLRIKNINLGYSLPNSIVQKLKMKQLRIYVNISDLYTFDKLMKGYDVEAGSTAYPITSTFLFGATVKF